MSSTVRLQNFVILDIHLSALYIHLLCCFVNELFTPATRKYCKINANFYSYVHTHIYCKAQYLIFKTSYNTCTLLPYYSYSLVRGRLHCKYTLIYFYVDALKLTTNVTYFYSRLLYTSHSILLLFSLTYNF